MAAKLYMLLLSSFLFTTFMALALSPTILSSSTKTSNSTVASSIQSYCGNAVYPRLCIKLFKKHANSTSHPTNATQLTQMTIVITVNRLRGLSKHVSLLVRNATSLKEVKALKGCKDTLGDAAKEARRSAAELAELESTITKPKVESLVAKAQEYMGRALMKEDLCADKLNKMDDEPTKNDVSRRVRQVKQLTSNSLSLIPCIARDN